MDDDHSTIPFLTEIHDECKTHDRKKGEMIEFVREHAAFFRTQQLVATGHTAKRLQEELGLEVEGVTHGPEGGDLIIGGWVAQVQEGIVEFIGGRANDREHRCNHRRRGGHRSGRPAFQTGRDVMIRD